jgi:diguanylate cyclase (GGDEF)-like protein
MNAPFDSHQLLSGLRALADLEGGRRDLAGVLTRGAALLRDLLGAEHAQVGVALESSSLIACTQRGRTLIRTEPWEGPGALGRETLAAGGPVVWTAGDLGREPSKMDLLGVPEPTWWAGVPVALGSSARGLAAVFDTRERILSDDDVHTLDAVAGHLGVCLNNLLTFQKTEALALTDELTRLYNFRFLKTALKREMERASRYGQVFSIIMIDVDHLKRYNDQHGHLAGSDLLQQLAGILSRSSRAIDLVAKYGGDEFLIILPQTRLDGAVSMANRIRIAVEESAFRLCKAGEMTISVGVASYPQHGNTVKGLVAAADKALFTAKRLTRNCVQAAVSPGDAEETTEAA